MTHGAFEWPFTYESNVGQTTTELLIGTIHVDAVLLGVQGEHVRAGFM